jgi:metal-responsive CopG/Arc/MetJ family transcriptional regulator
MRQEPTNKGTRKITVKAPEPLASAVDEAVIKLDLDLSKFVRSAIREKLKRHGFSVSAN